MNHLRFSGIDFEAQAAVLEAILRRDSVIWPAICLARNLALPDWLIVSGAIYNTVWNALTCRPAGYGIKDIDLFYHNASDLTWEAEDAIIAKCVEKSGTVCPPIEVRNQARVHVWFPERFGIVCPRYETSAHSLLYFASKTHAVGVRLDADDKLSIEAPFGLDNIFSFVMTPNRVLENRVTHEAKSTRAKLLWPEVNVVPW